MSLIRAALVAGWTVLLIPASLADDLDRRDLDRRERITEPSAPLPFGQIDRETPIIDQQLDSLESRVLRHSERPIEQKQLHRDLRASEQRLEAFKTQHPNATATPLHERQLDRLNRPARVREPGPPTLLDR